MTKAKPAAKEAHLDAAAGTATLLLFPLALLILAMALPSCGRSPSSLLRQGQIPVYDFPMYLSEGAAGNVWKYARDGSRTLLIDGLNDPRGLATDKFSNLYVVERGENRVLKVNTGDGTSSVVVTDLDQPSVLAVDSFSEAFIAQDGPRNVLRVSDGTVYASYDAIPSALVFGVSDTLIAGFYDSNLVIWGPGASAPQADVTQPVKASVDGTGRVYVAEGGDTDGRVLRFQQLAPGGVGVVVADQLQGPQGIAVDPVGDVYIVEQGAGRIVLAAHDGALFAWQSGLSDPQDLAFTQY